MADHKAHKKVKLDFSVVGLRHRTTPATLEKIALAVPLEAKLERESGNIHDHNAVAVYLTEKPWSNFHIGYLKREVAAEVAPKLDEGKLTITSVTLRSVDLISSTGEITIQGYK